MDNVLTLTKKNNFLKFSLNNSEFFLSTLLKTEHGEHTFQIYSFQYLENQYFIKWHNDQFGNIEQKFSSEIDRKKLLFDYQLELYPDKDVSGLIRQVYSFEPIEEPYFMIPGSLYGTNNIKNSKSNQPQLNYRGDIFYPKTSVIFTRADRSTHNAVLSLSKNLSLGIRINESTFCNNDQYYNGLGIDTRNFDKYDRISVSIGYHHFPVQYKGKLKEHSYTEEQIISYINFISNQKYKTDGHIYFSTSSRRIEYEKIIKHFYYKIHQHPGNNSIKRNEAVKLLSDALLNGGYDKNHGYFPTVVSGKYEDTGCSGDSAWTGGMQVVYPLLRSGKFNKKAKEFALNYISKFVKEAFNHNSGFFNESKENSIWNVSGWWKEFLVLYTKNLDKLEEAHSAYINGQAVTYILKSYQYAQENNCDAAILSPWLSVCEKIINNVISQERYDGALGVYFDPKNGECVYYNSFQGAWFLAAIAELYKITNKEKYLSAFNKANPFYYEFIKNVELWGTPIDTSDAVDEEGNLAFITALTSMHKVTKQASLLVQLEHALHYEFSWKFAYNTRSVNEPLKSLNWSSSGGSITSSHNIHIHQMGNLICEEIYYVFKETGNQYYLDRLKDTLNWGLGTFNIFDKQFGFGKSGWATEQFFHSDGVQDDISRVPDGGIWYDYLPWAAACVLLSCSIDVEEEFYYK